MLRLVQFVLAIILAAFVLPTAAMAQGRVALVVGNSTYNDPTVPALTHATGDATLIATRLSEAGFEVIQIMDGDLATLKLAVSEFGQRLRASGQSGAGLFYFVGHAVQSFGTNFLLPVDAALDDPANLDLVALDASTVMRQMTSARNQTNIVVLDASRPNPFQALAASGQNGLAEMPAPPGVFVSYAAAPGAVAVAQQERPSPFSAALARELLRPGQSIEEMFRRVRVSVLEQTLGRQTPWDMSALTEEFSFVPGTSTGLAAEAQAFSLAQTQSTVAGFDAFLLAYPNSVFAEAARMERESLAAAPRAPDDDPAELIFTPVGTPTPEISAEERLWASVRSSQDPVELTVFLQAYPNSVHAGTAQAMLDAVQTTNDTAGAVPAADAPVAEAAATTAPGESEQALLAAARQSKSASDYQAYLETYPNGVFAELARIELETLLALEQVQSAAPAAEPVETAALAEQSTPNVSTAATPTVAFDRPLAAGSDAVRGRSIAQLINGSPLFSPIAGLPEAVWKNQPCTQCHQWDATNLCTQAGTYLKMSEAEAGSKQHPYGGTFKQGLRQWAEAGCP